MILNNCPICSCKKKKLIWYNKIRVGKDKFSREKRKIYECALCSVRYLQRVNLSLRDNSIFRKIYDGDNSIKKYHAFNKPRELRKLKFISQYVSFKNKKILETNCGAASILDYLRKNNKVTAGQDSIIYKNFVKKKHLFFENFKQIKKSKIKFDIILSLAELEHTYDPIKFIKDLVSFLSKNGKIVIRIPNYNNIYHLFLGEIFDKYDFRESHNFYFCEKSLNFLFKKANLNVIKKIGYNEYDTNHFIDFLKNFKRVKGNTSNIVKKKNDRKIIKNINNSLISTSFLYILKK